MQVKEGIHVFLEDRVVTAKPEGGQFLRTNLFLDEPWAQAHVHGSFGDAISATGLKVVWGKMVARARFLWIGMEQKRIFGLAPNAARAKDSESLLASSRLIQAEPITPQVTEQVQIRSSL